MAAKVKTNMKLLKVGADVEMFLKNKDNAPVPCVGIVGGTKGKPIPLPGLGAGFGIQEDNVMPEFNIPPAQDVQAFVSSIGAALHSINGIFKAKELTPTIVPSMRFPMKDLESRQAQTIGCEPDFNVWERCENQVKGFEGPLATLRTAGGHVHVSFEVDGRIPQMPDDIEYLEAVVMGMDVFLGVPFTKFDQDIDRRKLYGKAGAFRIKPYGIEYRVLSNCWITTPSRTAYVFNQVEKVFAYLNKYGIDHCNTALREMYPLVLEAINNNRPDYQNHVMQQWGIAAVPNG